jgi:hypothetical protein
MRNVSNKICRENQNTHFIFSDFFPENRPVYQIMSTNMVQAEKTQMIWRLRMAHWRRKLILAKEIASTRARTPTYTQEDALAHA